MSQCPTLAFNTTLFNNSEDIMSYLDVYIDSLYDDAVLMKCANQDLLINVLAQGLLTYIPLEVEVIGICFFWEVWAHWLVPLV